MKPSREENEHIFVEELTKRITKLNKEQQEKSAAEKRQLKEAHWMHCPKCGQQLSQETCGTVEIDICPSCKGVWLDMGELGRIAEGESQGSFFNRCLRLFRKSLPDCEHFSDKPK